MTNREQEPPKYAKFYLDANGERLECVPENTFAFLYEDTRFDHIFYVTQETEEGFNGFYFWREMLGDRFDDLAKYMIDAGFSVENENELQECDEQAYYKTYPEQIKLPTYELTPRQDGRVKWLGYLLTNELLTAEDFEKDCVL